MVEVRRLTTEEVRARLAELDKKHPTWAAIYELHQDPAADPIWQANEDVYWHADSYDYETYRFLLGGAE